MSTAVWNAPAGSDNRPSFFEVYASQNLNSAILPAVRFVVEVLSLRNTRLRPLLTWIDEVFTGVLLAVEAAQLHHHSALVSESLYALRRSSPRGRPLPRLRVLASLLLDVVVPYLKAKLDQYHSSSTAGAAADLFVRDEAPPTDTQPRPIRTSLMSTIRTQFLRNYPLIFSSVTLTNTLFNVLYLYGYSDYFSLSLALQRLVLRRDITLESLQISDFMNSVSSPSSLSLRASVRFVLRLLKTSFIASILAFRFLQFFYAAEVRAKLEYISLCFHLTMPILFPCISNLFSTFQRILLHEKSDRHSLHLSLPLLRMALMPTSPIVLENALSAGKLE